MRTKFDIYIFIVKKPDLSKSKLKGVRYRCDIISMNNINRRGNQEWTIQRQWQHRADMTHDGKKQQQKTKEMTNTDPT